MFGGKKSAGTKIITVRGYAKKRKISPFKIVLIIVAVIAVLLIIWAAIISTLFI